MNKSKVALGLTLAAIYQHAWSSGFLDDSKASVSSRTLYFEGDQRGANGVDQRQSVTGLKFDFSSGYTPGLVGVGLDIQGLLGVNLGGGISPHSSSTSNTISPVASDGTPVDNWSRLGANAKIKLSKTELKAGNALAPNLPILVANDSRLLPQSFQGAMATSKEFDDVTFTAGQLNRAIGRASSNWGGISAGGRKGADAFRFAGADWKPTKDLMLQYYYAQLEDYYGQSFLGLTHDFQISPEQSFKTDLRYFNSHSDGENGSNTNYQYKNGYNAGGLGEVNNNTWSAAFTYSLGGNSLTLGHQRVSDSGGMPYVTNGNLVDGRGRPEGEGGASVYLYTDIMINNFTRAGENSSFGIYRYDFAGLGLPGLKAQWTYVKGHDIRGVGNGTTGRYSEWESDYRLDYTLQSGSLKGLGFSLRRANYRTELPTTTAQDQDQTRFYINYTYALW
ncbi:outer membrane porin, OprD family [Pseudomonas sp. MD195_PC81_125]|uniref:OprD family outer membrane porin n=2 Tax=Pseudomonas sp. MD195_PC81_125 TaxID=2741560 RepID=UPI0015FCCF3A|nr:OprD family outer membrane porin [Pseudomonas sp. MD195_PC81_125]MBA5979057.1 outer membrane porin, OprD family [Pseudomonas sp. MD195_PC81_125]